MIKRYSVNISHVGLRKAVNKSLEEYAEGEWVKWEDVEPLLSVNAYLSTYEFISKIGEENQKLRELLKDPFMDTDEVTPYDSCIWCKNCRKDGHEADCEWLKVMGEK